MATFEGGPIPVDDLKAVEIDGVRYEGQKAMREALDALQDETLKGVMAELPNGFRTYLGKMLANSGRSAIGFDKKGNVLL